MNNIKVSNEEPSSPCIRHCCLDKNDTCIGCFRTLDEILAWHSASPAQKQQILNECQNRKDAQHK
ncbi:DUF1289 domain-containing protein [Pseudoalteromonas ostreae]|uniref:DUF1289 domain-containing protein n=1 Tax=Pseudoalteromonas ostreae TaxID=2774154 RepID=UPI001B379268|nr:DUF1289 domain-containing protein [Pseudoalteromonas ostreae]